MKMFNEDDMQREKRARCQGCEYKRMVHANGGFNFYGCYHRPYKGKRVVEIKECPKSKELSDTWKQQTMSRFERVE